MECKRMKAGGKGIVNDDQFARLGDHLTGIGLELFCDWILPNLCRILIRTVHFSPLASLNNVPMLPSTLLSWGII